MTTNIDTCQGVFVKDGDLVTLKNIKTGKYFTGSNYPQNPTDIDSFHYSGNPTPLTVKVRNMGLKTDYTFMGASFDLTRSDGSFALSDLQVLYEESSYEIEDLEMELIEINTDFWKG